MGRDTGAKCKQCRREGEKLFLKGDLAVRHEKRLPQAV